MKSVSELKKGDILTNTNHGFDIEIKEIGKKNTRYINLETGEKIKSFTSKFNFMLRAGILIKKQIKDMDSDEANHLMSVNMAKVKATFTEDDEAWFVKTLFD